MKVHAYIPLVISLFTNFISTVAIPTVPRSSSGSPSPPSVPPQSRHPPPSRSSSRSSSWSSSSSSSESESTGTGVVQDLIRKHGAHYKSDLAALVPDVAAFREHPPAKDGFKHGRHGSVNMDWVDRMVKFSVAATFLATRYSTHQPIVDAHGSLEYVGLGKEEFMEPIGAMRDYFKEVVDVLAEDEGRTHWEVPVRDLDEGLRTCLEVLDGTLIKGFLQRAKVYDNTNAPLDVTTLKHNVRSDLELLKTKEGEFHRTGGWRLEDSIFRFCCAVQRWNSKARETRISRRISVEDKELIRDIDRYLTTISQTSPNEPFKLLVKEVQNELPLKPPPYD
ncbi:hypothetical protein H0H93_011632, partial [Arthromyces matolae]